MHHNGNLFGALYPYIFGYQLSGAACTEISSRLLWLAMPSDRRSDLTGYAFAPQAPFRHDVVGVVGDVRPGSCASGPQGRFPSSCLCSSLKGAMTLYCSAVRND